MKRLFALFTFAILFISSCSTDFEINADWKEITVVYGLLNQTDTIHYIKINKAFLGKGNALTFAQNPDSSSYGNNLEVRIEEWMGSSLEKTYYLDTITIANKDSGVFYYPKQIVYQFVEPNLNENSTYKLIIKNKSNGKLITSETQLVRNFSVIKPSPSQPTVSFHASNPVEVKWYSAKYGSLYQLVIRFNYKEKNIITNVETLKHLDWNLGSQSSDGIVGGKPMLANYNGASFFSYLGSKIPVDPNIQRSVTIPNVEFMFSVAGDDFATYIEVNKPSTGIIQEKPEFTNISNGIGVFSSRFIKTLPFAMQPVSLDSLKNGQYTKNLNFY
jgi:hypothetical protein